MSNSDLRIDDAKAKHIYLLAANNLVNSNNLNNNIAESIGLPNLNNRMNELNDQQNNIVNAIHLSHNHKAFVFDSANRGWLQTIIDSSHLITFCISISVIIYGSFRSLNIDKENHEIEQDELLAKTNDQFNSSNSNNNNNSQQQQQQQSVQTINSAQALFIPVAASISLLVMFFYFESIQTAFVICTSILATVAFSFLLSPVCKIIIKFLFSKNASNQIINKKISCCFIGKFTSAELLAFSLSSLLVILWILTGHWLLMDLIGVGFCVTFIAIVRLPSLKVSTLLLVGLVIYDVLWVYFSHLIFSSNVMVKVATKEADNPMGILARKLNIESSFSNNSPKLSLPGKLIVPSYQRTGNFSILGLGDIVIPGLLLCFVLRFDAYKRSQLYKVIMTQQNAAGTENTACTKKQQQQHDQNEQEACCDCLDCKLNDHKSFYNNKDDLTKLNNSYLNNSNLNNSTSHSYPFLFNSQYQQFNINESKRLFKRSYSLRNIIKFNKLSYFHCSLIGYFVGLITATLSSEIFREAQPALLYLVPFTLLPLLTMAYLKGDLRLMWNEPFSYSTPKYFYV